VISGRAWRRAFGLAAAVAGLALPPASARAQTAPAGVRLGFTLSADTVTVGTPFVLSVRVSAPLGDSIVFPAGPDSTAAVQALDPLSVIATGDTAAVDRTARYRLAAWDVGEQEIALEPLTLVTADGRRELELPPVRVFVQSVLPADTALRVPRPPRAMWEFPRPWWIPWLIGLVALGLLGLLLWWLLRRRRRPRPTHAVEPFVEAEQRFAALDALGLVEAGERSRYVALVVEIVREYLARRVTAASPALTSRELLAAVAGRREVPHDRLAALLLEGDLVKFARRPVTAERAGELGMEGRAVVRAVEDATRAAQAPPSVRTGGGGKLGNAA
jgi:hypothetical protein